MLRETHDYERDILNVISKSTGAKLPHQKIFVESTNNDDSIVKINIDDEIIGNTRLEFASVIFEDNDENLIGCLIAFGDEKGFLRELDFHNIADGLTVRDLTRYSYKIFTHTKPAF